MKENQKRPRETENRENQNSLNELDIQNTLKAPKLELSSDPIFKEFGNKNRNPEIDPDATGSENGGIHVFPKDSGRPEDPPVLDSYRLAFHQLHNMKLVFEKQYPDKFQELNGKGEVDNLILGIASAVKKAAMEYKKDYRDFTNPNSRQALQKAFQEKIKGFEKTVYDKFLIMSQAYQKANGGKAIDPERLKEEGTEIWREKWHATIINVNKVLSDTWPTAKKEIQQWTKKKQEEEKLAFMDPDQIRELDYIGSLAKGYKSPPKQSVRFQPEKFDVDANLDAPPLAVYAVKKGVGIDRGKLSAQEAGISPIIDFEKKVHSLLLDKPGYDKDDPFSVVIDAEGIGQVKDDSANDAKTALADSKADLEVRDAIWRLRETSPERYKEIAPILLESGLAVKNESGQVVLKTQPFSSKEVESITKLITSKSI